LTSLTDKKNKNKSQEFFAINRKVEKSRKKSSKCRIGSIEIL